MEISFVVVFGCLLKYLFGVSWKKETFGSHMFCFKNWGEDETLIAFLTVVHSIQMFTSPHNYFRIRRFLKLSLIKKKTRKKCIITLEHACE